MRLQKLSYLMSFTAACFLVSLPVQAQTYIGEACWSVTDDDSGPTDALVKLGVMEIGDGHLNINGAVLDDDEGTFVVDQLLNGNGEIVGEEIHLGLTGVAKNTDAIGTVTYHIELQLSDLSGVYNSFFDYFDRIEEETVNGQASGTLALAACE